MLIAVNNRWRQYACYWHTKSNIRKTFSYWEETTNAPALTEYMGEFWARKVRELSLDWRPIAGWLTCKFTHFALFLLFEFRFYDECKRRYTIKLWKTFTDCFNCLPVAAIGKCLVPCSGWTPIWHDCHSVISVSGSTVDEKIFTCHGGLSPDLASMEQIRRIMRPTDVPDQGLLCDLLWSDPDKDTMGWGENDRGVSFTFGPEVIDAFWIVWCGF